MAIDEKTWKKGKYKELGIKPESFRKIKSRALGPDGKVYEGAIGLRLQKKKQAQQEYYKRNR